MLNFDYFMNQSIKCQIARFSHCPFQWQLDSQKAPSMQKSFSLALWKTNKQTKPRSN